MTAQPIDSGVPTETPESGHSIRALAAALGVSKSTIARDLRGVDSAVRTSCGLDGKEYASPSAREHRRLLHRALRAQGVSERIIAEQTGWSQATVHRDLQTEAIPCFFECQTILSRPSRREKYRRGKTNDET